MGMFDISLKDLDPIRAIKKAGDAVGDFFDAGARDAAKKAKALGQQQLEREEAFMGELGTLYDPRIQAGETAFQSISDYYSGNQQPLIDMATSSPMYSSLLSQGEEAIARNRQATGGFRSGTTQQNLAQNSQNVLMDQINQILQGQQYVANTGGNALNAMTQQKANTLGAIGATTGQIANVDIAKAAQRQNMIGGIVDAGAKVGAAALSDIRLKKNILKIDEKNGLNWYSWDWNEKAEDIGLYGSDVGHIAQEVEKVRPDLVVNKDGYKAVIYEGF